jgi:hypothetical protein
MVANLDAGNGFKNVKVAADLFASGEVKVTTDPTWYKEKE